MRKRAKGGIRDRGNVLRCYCCRLACGAMFFWGVANSVGETLVQSDISPLDGFSFADSIRVAVELGRWSHVDAVYSLNGFCWHRVPLVADVEEGSLQWWQSESMAIPPQTTLSCWFLLKDTMGNEVSSLDSMLPFNHQRASTLDDVDGDGLPDAWEMFWWNSLELSADANPDGDMVAGIHLSSAYEWFLGLDPTVPDVEEDIVVIWQPLRPVAGESVRILFYLEPDEEILSESIYAVVAGSESGGMAPRWAPLSYCGKTDRYIGEITAPDEMQDLVVILVNERGVIDDNCHLGWTIRMKSDDGFSSISSVQTLNSSDSYGGTATPRYDPENDALNVERLGIVYVDAHRGRGDYDGSVRTPAPSGGNGPKKRVDSGIAVLEPVGGTVIIASGMYIEQGVPVAGRIVLKPQGHVVIRCQ